ncbi:MAG: deoxyguanosinetriphosphate triphosphohydrolase [Oleibacter sp.]|nr:deoxyguanosinetriphosphate triphosphohydrolase [Thalassolituus sp.]
MTRKMNWEQLLSPIRHGEIQTRLALDSGRSAFHKDYDRIVFSSAFRRLDRKTQVHPLVENDHIHSRLTHSLEVGCVGRSLGSNVAHRLGAQLPSRISAGDVGDIVQAACLAHDIGNPPYGHTGEDAIRYFFSEPKNAHFLEGLSDAEIIDLQTFEGNAQGLRIVSQVEGHRFEGGMRLTYATMGAFIKYPWSSNYVANGQQKKFGCYQSELAILTDVATNLGLLSTGEHAWCRHPLVYLLEAADDICYCLIDLEDGIELQLLRYDEVETLIRPVFGDIWETIEPELRGADNERRRIQMLRGYAMEIMVNAVSDAFVREQEALLSGKLHGSIIDYCAVEVQELVTGAKRMARERIFNDARKLAVEVGSYATLSVLLEGFLSAVNECVTEGGAKYRNRRIIDLMGRSAPQPDWSLYSAYMRALDYISGMTDNHAAMISRQFSGYQPD